VNAPVKFDRKFDGIAVEIDDVSFDCLLTAEVEPSTAFRRRAFQSIRSAGVISRRNRFAKDRLSA
jgi:hypothetical protein